MPIWALTEILELGHLGRLYSGLQREIATEIAGSYGVPTKRLFASWAASINYVRNVAAHHARLFNRKLVRAPMRPPVDAIPGLDHLQDARGAKSIFGVYNLLAVMAHLISTIDEECEWTGQMATLLSSFPSGLLDSRSMGLPPGWEDLELWGNNGSVS